VIAPTALLAWLVLTASGSAGESVSTGTIDILKTIAIVYGGALALTVFVLAGPALGIALRRRSLLSDRRTLLVVGLVLGALLTGPFAVGAVVGDDGGDEVDYEGPTWNTTDEDGWNDSNIDETNESTENDSISVTKTTLGEVRCSVPIDGIRETPDVNHSVATNGTLPEDFRVEYYRFGSDSYVYRFEQWNQTEVVSVEADSSTGDGPFAVDYLGVVELYASADELPARLWVDVVNDDGEVVRHQMDLCPPPENADE
jgi:type IV secretory pathway VirB2 component (pilin)